MRLVEKYVVCQGADPALFPGITRAANGDLLVSCCTRFDCQAGGEAFLLRSTDQGRTWTPPTRIRRSERPDGCMNLSIGLTTLRDGTVLYPCCDARITRKWDQHDADLVILRSDDHGHTWTGQDPIATGVKEPFAYGKILELTDGDLLCPIWGKRVEDEPWRSGLIRSRNGGRTWGEYVTIAYDPDASMGARVDADVHHCAGFNETTLLELPSGSLMAILRQQGLVAQQRQLYGAASADQGHTWSEPLPLGLWGTSPSLHRTPSGQVLLGYRNHLRNPQGLRAPGVGVSVSQDQGMTWAAHLLLEDPRGYSYRHEFEAGYPAFMSLDERRTLVIFYSYDPTLPAEHYLAANVLSMDPPRNSNRHDHPFLPSS